MSVGTESETLWLSLDFLFSVNHSIFREIAFKICAQKKEKKKTAFSIFFFGLLQSIVFLEHLYHFVKITIIFQSIEFFYFLCTRYQNITFFFF